MHRHLNPPFPGKPPLLVSKENKPREKNSQPSSSSAGPRSETKKNGSKFYLPSLCIYRSRIKQIASSSDFSLISSLSTPPFPLFLFPSTLFFLLCAALLLFSRGSRQGQTTHNTLYTPLEHVIFLILLTSRNVAKYLLAGGGEVEGRKYRENVWSFFWFCRVEEGFFACPALGPPSLFPLLQTFPEEEALSYSRIWFDFYSLLISEEWLK